MGRARASILAGVAAGLVLVGAVARGADPPPAPARAPTIEERLLKLEEMNRQLLDENRDLRRDYKALSDRFDEVSRKLDDRPDTSSEGGAGARDNPAEADSGTRSAAPTPAADDVEDDSTAEGGEGARDNPIKSRDVGPRPAAKKKKRR